MELPLEVGVQALGKEELHLRACGDALFDREPGELTQCAEEVLDIAHGVGVHDGTGTNVSVYIGAFRDAIDGGFAESQVKAPAVVLVQETFLE